MTRSEVYSYFDKITSLQIHPHFLMGTCTRSHPIDREIMGQRGHRFQASFPAISLGSSSCENVFVCVVE